MENKQQPKENLRIQSSVYPDGWNNQTPEQYNSTWRHIYGEAATTLEDPRQYDNTMHKVFGIN